MGGLGDAQSVQRSSEGLFCAPKAWLEGWLLEAGSPHGNGGAAASTGREGVVPDALPALPCPFL